MTVYEFNKANYANLPTMTEEELEKSIPYIVSFLDKHKSKYYLMVDSPHERDSNRYYTVFTFPKDNYNPGAMAREIIDIAQSLGPVKSIEDSGGDILEIWVGEQDNCRMYGFFDWAEGVIEVL